MKLTIHSREELAALAEARWGHLDGDEALAELLRAELTARSSYPRWGVLRRVATAASAFTSDDLESRLRAVCTALEAEGDFSRSNGLLHVAPVRGVELQPGMLRIIASLPTHRLGPRLPGELMALGVRRTLRFEPDLRDTVVAAVGALGGVVISPQAWAGLESSPVADAQWLASLEDRLEWQPQSAGRRDGPRDWFALVLHEAGPRWTRAREPGVRLWRARNQLGYWEWAWSREGHSPASDSFVGLSVDDARRTVFAMARQAQRPIVAKLVRAGELAHMRLREWLPWSEYRYLAMLASWSRIDGVHTWSIPAARVDEVLDTLAHRLGLVVREDPEP
jgi:hypothetical protein